MRRRRWRARSTLPAARPWRTMPSFRSPGMGPPVSVPARWPEAAGRFTSSWIPVGTSSDSWPERLPLRVRDQHPLDAARFAGLLVDVDEGGGKADVALGDLERAGGLEEEALEDLVDPHADH